jgi:hypothetical protein
MVSIEHIKHFYKILKWCCIIKVCSVETYYIKTSTSLLSVSQLSGKCEILDISQPYTPPRPVTGIAAFFATLPQPFVMSY